MSLSLSKVQQFRQPPLQYASQNESQSFSAPGPSLQLLGGIFQDTRHVWHAKGASLEVRDTKTGRKVGAWVFGCVLKDSNTKIVCVEEIERPHGRLSMLAVGLECTISGGVICFFDVFSSKVVRAIQINEKISALHIIDPGIEDLNLPGPLRNFDGIMSIGTQGGNVYLVDICRQICEESLHSPIKRDELNPSQLVLLTSTKITRIEHYKEKCVRDNNHLAIHLNTILESNTEHFTLKGPKGDDRIHVNREEVLTSGLYYCPQLTSLLVGYNFGAFQLWNLTTLQLVYTSPVCDEHLPVNRFALQEPADDPRAFCYIWVSYSNTEQFQSGLPFAVMYSVCYESKEYQEGYGYLYQDFQYCAVRFQIELGTMDDQRHTSPPKGGRCLALQPIAKPPSPAKDAHSISGDALVLCMITWSVWHAPAESHTCTALFDLNQWYKEQMPAFDKWQDSANYLLRTRASDALDVLDVRVDQRRLRQFRGVQRLEEHFYPSALSFDVTVLRENEVVSMRRQGEQHLLLAQIEATGPLCLVKPASVARRAVAVGLLPLFTEETGVCSEESQRELLLNLGLEHRLLGWLCKCASEWASGSFASAGCSLDFLLEWAYRRGADLKAHCDRFCEPLFDYSQVRLDGNTAALLTSCVRQIGDLCGLYAHVTGKLEGSLGCSEVVGEQYRSLQMVSVYFEVLQWLVNIGLLPECPPSAYPRRDTPDKISAPYPVEDLVKFYDRKRLHLNDDLLFIDNLVERKCGGSRLQQQWRADGGTGLYPPPSLQSLIRAYLVDGAGIAHKHSLVIYLFLDLAMALDQERYSPVITYLIKFPAVFKVSASSTKVTQAFWQLDHGDFSTALEHLLDPLLLAEDLQDWHHSLVIRALCAQKQFNYALLYLQTARPPMTSEPDQLAAVSLFVANRMLDEAFYFVKRQRSVGKLLSHFFDECRRHDALRDLLYRNFSETEERAFVGFLLKERDPASEELQVFYYLLRSRFLEAFDAHEAGARSRQGLVGQSKASKADQVVRIFRSLLPDVSKKLVEYVRKERGNLWREVRRPTPLSVFVHDNDEKIRYKSTLVHAALAKARQTDRNGSREVLTETTPFLRTPKANKSASKFVTPVITPRVVELTDDSPSPAKRAKLSPTLLTPIVRRKLSGHKNDSLNLHTPHSILRNDLSAVLARTPRQHVQFDISARVSSSFSEPPTALEDQILQGSSKDNTNSTSEETFFSPDNSLVEEKPERMEHPVEESEVEQEDKEGVMPRARRSYKRSHKEMSPVRSSPRLAKLVDNQPDQVSSNKSTEPSTSDESVLQSPRMLQRVKGRKSLSRQVLEHNAFSKIRTPVAVTTEISFTKTEKTTVLEKSPTASKLTVVEARLDVSDVSNADPQSPAGRSVHSVTSNVSRRSVLESDISFDSDTSISSDIFVQVKPKIRVPEIPEWLNEYAAKLQAQKDTGFNTPEEEEKEPPVEEMTALPVEEVTAPPAEEVTESPVGATMEPPVEEEPPTLEEVVIKENGGKVIEASGSPMNEEKSNEVISMEIYEDLSCGSEASSEDRNEDFNELELNVFEVTKNAASEFSPSDERYVQLSSRKDSPEEEAIVIVSSGEESGQSNESIYQEDMNLSFERNIREEDYSTDDSSDAEAHARSDDGIAGNDSSTEKWGFHDKDDQQQVVLATEQLSEAGEDTQLVFDQGEAANGQENGDSSSSSTEKWNYSDREDVDDHLEAESLRDGEPEEQPDSQTVASGDEFETNEVHSTDALVAEHQTSKVDEAIEEGDNTIPVGGGELQNVEEAFVAAEAQSTEVRVAIGEGNIQIYNGKLPNMKDQALVASEDQTSRVGEELQDMEQEALVDSEDQTSKVGEAIEEDKIQLDGEELQNMEKETIVASKDHNPRVVEEEHFEVGTGNNSNKSNGEVADIVLPTANKDEDLESNEASGKIQSADAGREQELPSVDCQDHAKGIDAKDKSTERNDQPIETTTAANNSERGSKRNKKKDQSTNTTIKETVKAKSKSSKDSSSDTTEGDPASQEIVVTALVHTPSRSETEEPLLKRVTRRSLLLAQKSEADLTPSIFEDTRIESNMDVSSSDDVAGNALTPVRRRARKPSQNNDIIDCQSSTSKETVAEPKVAALLRKTRSASVDDVKTYSRKRSLQRSNSVDEAPVTEKPSRSKGKAKSVVLMPAISEEQSAKSYATSRRLTRSQANMVKEIKGSVDLEECGDTDKTIQLDYIDPIVLLDKESYQGDRDPEEKKIYEGSSPSESIASSFSRPTRRKSRSVSVASDISLPLSPSKSVTPEKKPTRKYGSGVKTRLRKVSETSSVVSEKSETATPTKKTRKNAEVSDVEVSKPSRTTRSRVNSVSSAKSDPASSPRKSSRSRRLITAKIDLPEITEEKINEVTVASTTKRQTRKRKSP